MDTTQPFQWVPLPTWRGRYRCAKTGTLGFRPSEAKMISSSGDPNEIVPYTCSRQGCESPASIRHKQKCFCESHKPKARM
jgi:hypothetical protein